MENLYGYQFQFFSEECSKPTVLNRLLSRIAL
jgi:hypothetical protein